MIEPRHPRSCTCGVKARYGIVPSELGVGYYYGHVVGKDIVSFMHIIYIFYFDILCWLYFVNGSSYDFVFRNGRSTLIKMRWIMRSHEGVSVIR